uniref:Glycosyl hydrolase superfamily protein isoform 2 n=1 Tax=Tanacetum cinerariifolium TaxID=118510 RepID=A0A6L2JAK5_TANCI|nr:glycosyl hydrolase superfamily protein isoform 2 [Tanacetum cinerariifolium]
MLNLLQVLLKDIYGHHDVSCAEISVGKEFDIRLSDGVDKSLHLADMLLYSWDGDLNVCVDLTGSSPLIDATQRKCVKYEAKCAKIGYGFLPSYSLLCGIREGCSDLIEVDPKILCGSRPYGASCSLYLYLFKDFAEDIYGDHVVSGIIAGKEVDIGLDRGRDKPLRPSDILLYSWDGGLDVCVDLTGSSPLTGCQDGGGNGLTKTSLITHLRDWHCSGEAQAITKHSLLTDVIVFERAEATLKRMGLWLCGVCYKTHTLRAKRRHGKDIVPPSDCGDGVVRFVLYDLIITSNSITF